MPIHQSMRSAVLESVAMIAMFAGPAQAQQPTLPYQYSAKIVCGSQREMQGVVPQAYMTTVNVHNPSDSLAIFFKTLLVTLPPGGQRPVPPSRPTFTDTLRPQFGLATDCADLRKRYPNTPAFFEGFVLLQSRISLDVVAVYTVPGGIDVVHVPERIRRG